MSVKFSSLDWKPEVKMEASKGYFFGTIKKNVEPMIEGGKLISTAVKDKLTYYLIEKPREKVDTRLVAAAKVKPVKEKKVKKVKPVKKARISKKPAKAVKKAKSKIKKVIKRKKK